MGKYQDEITIGIRIKRWHLESDNHPTAPMDWIVCELCGHRGLGEPPMIGRQGRQKPIPRSGDRYCINCNRIIECRHQGIHIGETK